MYSYFHSQTFPQAVFQYGCTNTHRGRHRRNFERCKKTSRILRCQNSETLGNGKSKTPSSASEKPRNSLQVNVMRTTINVGDGTSFLHAEGGKVFLLINASDKEAAMEILKAQSLQQVGIDGFMIRNPISNVGDVIELYRRSMDSNAEIQLTKEVYVIGDSASSATFDRRIISSICHQNMETQVLEMPRGNFRVTEVDDNDRGNTGTASTVVAPPLIKPSGGIGIVNFLEKKNYFITGATGFVAKVFIEKMLRTAPDVGKIYLLMKAKDKEAALQRLNTDIMESELFKKLQEVHGKSYKAFMRRKLIPVIGNVCESNLGMDAHSANLIAKEVDVIINSAANTTFDERYDVALNTNTKGPSHLLSFVKTCNKISVLVHISTAYVSGETQGIIMEKPYYMGQSIDREKASVPLLDIDFELKLASNFLQSVNINEATQKMKALGLYRAKNYGWQNTYSFTKAMGEMVINSRRGDIPVVIIRPTVIESTYKEPFPGWIQGNRMVDPLILSYGRGQLPGFIGDPNTIVDVVPVDMVVNASLAAMAKHGTARKPGLNVYHVASSVVNPISFGDIFEYCFEYFRSSPLMENGISRFKYFSRMDSFSSFIFSEIANQSGVILNGANSLESPNHTRKCIKMAELFLQMAKVYEPYAFYKGRFDIGNTKKLIKEMSKEEVRSFGFDMASINWKQYICSIHIPGLRKHVLKKG